MRPRTLRRAAISLAATCLLPPLSAWATAHVSGSSDEVLVYQNGWAHWAPTIPMGITSGSSSVTSRVYVTDDDRLSTAPNAAEILSWDGTGYDATVHGDDPDPTDHGPRGIAISTDGSLYFSVAERDDVTADGFDGDCIAKWYSTGSQSCVAAATGGDPGHMDTTSGGARWGEQPGTVDGLYWIQKGESGGRVLFRLVDTNGLRGEQVPAVPAGLTAFTFDPSDRLYFATSTAAGGSADGIYRMSAPAAPVETVVESSRALPLPMLENISDLAVGTRRTGTEFTDDVLYFSTIDFPAGSFRSEVFRIRNCMDENPEVEVVVENLRATMALAMRDGELLIGETSFTTGSIRRLTARWEGHFQDTWERDARPGAGWVEARNPSALSLESDAPIQGRRSLAVRVDGGSPAAYLVGAAREGIEDRAALVHLRLGPRELTIADGDSIVLFLATDGEASIFGLALLPRATGYELVAIAYDDAGNARPSAPIAIDDGATDVEILWRGSSGPDARDGLLRLRDLEAPGTVAEIADLDDDGLRISGWTLGASGSGAPATRGTLLLDAFRIYEPVDRDAISPARPRYRAARDPG